MQTDLTPVTLDGRRHRLLRTLVWVLVTGLAELATFSVFHVTAMLSVSGTGFLHVPAAHVTFHFVHAR
jgi:hypothetical protein